MEQSPLIELIRVLKPEEIAQIRYFAANPFFNNGRMRAYVIPLLDVFWNHPWHLQRLEKKEIFEKIFPGQEIVEGKLEKAMVEAHKVVKAFLLVQRYFQEKNEFHQWVDFSEIAREKGMDLRYRQAIAKIQKIQEESSKGSLQFFQRQFTLEYSQHEEAALRNQAKGDLNIPNTLYALEIEYYLKKLVLLNQYLIQQKIAHLEVPESIGQMIDEDNLPARYLEGSALLQINYEIFKLLKKTSPTASEIQNLFDLLLLHERDLDTQILIDFYNYLRNLCILAIVNDYENMEMAYILHKLYKDNLNRGYLHRDGKIGQSKYLGVANNALMVGELDWALEFIEKYKNNLHGENETRDIYRLNLAHYLFKIERFSDCLDNIPDTSPLLMYLIQGKRLELKAYYELRSDLLPYKLDAFKMFLSRTSQKLLSESQRQIHSDFANLLHQIISSTPGDPKRSELLVKRVHEKKQAAEWRWLLEKAKALKDT